MSKTNNNRMVLLLIAGTPLTMILAATWLWFYVARGELDLVGAVGTANRGTLIQPPRQIDEVALEQEGVALAYSELEPRWTLAIPWGASDCDASCEQTLYVTRQIHMALGKNFHRIQRMFISPQAPAAINLSTDRLSDGHPLPQDFASLLAGEHRRVRALQLDGEGFNRLFSEWDDDKSTWYLIDPGGWIMMSYTQEISYKEVIADLKFLLKNSSG